MLIFLEILLLRFGTSMPFSSTPVPDDSPLTVPLKLHTLSLRPKAPPALPLVPKPLSPSSSLSNLNAFCVSSFAALSARRAARPASLSLICNSSIVFSNFSILSLPLATSSCNCEFAFSLRSICSWRSLTVRSTFLTERWDFERSFSWASSWDSSCFLLVLFR
jgi:hypothetical protein